jgi:hypothetical protein
MTNFMAFKPDYNMSDVGNKKYVHILERKSLAKQLLRRQRCTQNTKKRSLCNIDKMFPTPGSREADSRSACQYISPLLLNADVHCRVHSSEGISQAFCSQMNVNKTNQPLCFHFSFSSLSPCVTVARSGSDRCSKMKVTRGKTRRGPRGDGQCFSCNLFCPPLHITSQPSLFLLPSSLVQSLVAVEWLAFLLRIRGNPGFKSWPGDRLAILTEGFRCFFSGFHANAGTVH